MTDLSVAWESAQPRNDWATTSRNYQVDQGAQRPQAAVNAVGGEQVVVFPLGLSDGRTIELSGSALIGRNPVLSEGESFDQLVVVTDPSLSVSKTHLVVAVSDGQLWVADRFSTNGTSVHCPDGQIVNCPPGEWVMAPIGSVIHFGAHWMTVAHT